MNPSEPWATVGPQSGAESWQPPPRKKRRLDYLKCDCCRRDKQKCLPSERRWPEEKCNRCLEKGFECSEPRRTKQLRSPRSAANGQGRITIPYGAPIPTSSGLDLGEDGSAPSGRSKEAEDLLVSTFIHARVKCRDLILVAPRRG